MSLQSLNGTMWLPGPISPSNSTGLLGTAITIDASTDKAATIFVSPFTDSIDKIAIGFATVTTAANLDFRVETVATTTDAKPTGTLWATNTAATGLTPVTNTVVEGTLTANASITKGDRVAIVVQPSGAGSINLNLNRMDNTTGAFPGGSMPYGSFNTTGSYANNALTMIMAVHLSSANKWAYIGDGIMVIESQTTAAITTGTGATTGTSRGNRFQLPFPARLSYIWWKGSAVAAADYNVELYDDGGTLLATLYSAYDSSQQRAATGPTYWMFPLTTTYNLAANTWYRIVLTPTTANAVTLVEYLVHSAAHLDAHTVGQQMFTTAFINSAWDDTNTSRRTMIGLGLDAFDDAVSTGTGSGTKSIF